MRKSTRLLLAAAGSTTLVGAAATTTTTTTSTTTTTTTSPSTTTSTTTTSSVVPAGYTVVSAGNFGVKCDGVTNDTNALQTALNSLQSQQALQLPSGTCLTSNQLVMQGKSSVMVFGAGKDATILNATDPLRSSFILTGNAGVILNGFQVASPNATYRTSDGSSRGFYVENSRGVTLDGVKASKVAGAGVLFHVVTDSKVVNSDVAGSLADAFHFTGASANILVQSNRATGAGDDCFASVGYGAGLNRNIQFLDNACSDNKASGVTFEGTIGGKAYRNQLTRTGVAAIRVASAGDWDSGVVDQIDIQNNVLNDVKTRTDVSHPAVLVYSTKASVTNVTFSGNTINNPRTWLGTQILNYAPTTATVSNISFNTTTNSSTTGTLTTCFGIGSSVGTLSFTSNTLNSNPCEPH